jgi:hypothetical protein
MKKNSKYSLIVLMGLVMPVFAFANTVNLMGVELLINQLQQIVRSLVPLLIGIAIVVFFWGIVVYIFTGDKEKGKQVMISGIIALFVMTSVWGLVNILQRTFLGPNITNVPVSIPTVDF